MKFTEVVKVLETELDKEFGLEDKNVNHKYIVETKCKYKLSNGGILTIKLLGDKIVEFKGKNCDSNEMQEFVEKLKKILKESK